MDEAAAPWACSRAARPVPMNAANVGACWTWNDRHVITMAVAMSAIARARGGMVGVQAASGAKSNLELSG